MEVSFSWVSRRICLHRNMSMKWPHAGFTLMEIILAMALLVMGALVVLFGMHVAMVNARYVQQVQVAMEAAQGQLSQLAATPLATLCPNPCPVNPINPPISRAVPLNLPVLPGGMLAIQISRSAQDPTPLNQIPSLVELHVAACWTIPQGWQGEDRNCNGVLDGAEVDTNNNGWIDSVVMVSTRVGGSS